MIHEGRFSFRNQIIVPDTGTGVHVPQRVSDVRGAMFVTVAEFYALPDNTNPIYVGWSASAVKGQEYPIPIEAGDVSALRSPHVDDAGRTEKFDLYDVWFTGSTDGDAIGVFTW
ncbi:MAG: hypothetical protein O7D91_17505 [Planctomycetota bacterium]|nr:hypothetical protein [Planctomycetota bacterium]